MRGWSSATVPIAMVCGITGCGSKQLVTSDASFEPAPPDPFDGTQAGEERTIGGLSFRWCPAGRFVMGSPHDEPDRRPDEVQTQVTLTKGFWIAGFETTQAHYKRIVGSLPAIPPGQLPIGDDYPVGNVTFADAESFCAGLTALARASAELPAKWEIRLPTEAQWEYAARAGTTTATAFGDSLSSAQANFSGKPYNGAPPGPVLGHAAIVGSYAPNGWGIHDMHGNTFEWCRDWYHAIYPGGIDPDLRDDLAGALRNPDGTTSRSRRGGAWTDDGWACRSAFRLKFEPDRAYDHIGFRVVAVRR